MTKQTINEMVLKFLSGFMHKESIVCTLQNGVPEPSVAEIVGPERTIGGIILWGATFIKPGESEVTQDLSRNEHLFEIGEMDGSVGPRIANIASILNYMGPVKITGHLMESRWGKLINNACMSGMSAVTGGTFGEVLDNDLARQCLSYIGREVKACCEAETYKLPILLHAQKPYSFELRNKKMFDENQKLFLEMYSDMREAKASMLQDLLKGKLTEVNFINGFVSSIGKKHGIKTPFNDKVVEIISKAERGELGLSMDNLSLFSPKWFRY